MIPQIPGISNTGQMPIDLSAGPSNASGYQNGTFRTGNISFGNGGVPWWVVLLLAGGTLYWLTSK